MRLIQVSLVPNTTIVAATLAGTFTAIRQQKLITILFADQVAGAGDYTAYLTQQKAGAGSAYILLPKTVATAAAGETAIGFPSIELAVGEGDVVKAYIKGLAGDNTTPDLRTEFWDADAGDVLLDTTIATLASQTSFTLTVGSTDNGAYKGCLIVIRDATTWGQIAVGVASDYTGASKTVALLTDPAIFTMAVGDCVTIVANRSLKAVVDNRNVVVDANGLVDANMVKNGPTGAGVGQTGRDLGLALPAAAPDAPGGLPISDAGGLDLDAQIKTDIDALVGGIGSGGIVQRSFEQSACFDEGSITVSDTAVNLPAATLEKASGGMIDVLLGVDDNPIYLALTGTAATVASMKYATGSKVVISGMADCKRLSMVRVSADATVRFQAFRRPI